MKKLGLATALLLAMTGAHAYQAEVQGTVGYYDAELNDGNYNVGAQGTYYFNDIDTSKGPLAEAAFLNQATSISAGYNFGQLTADIQTPRNEELDVEQHSYGVKGETYIPTSIVPVYASASYNHSKTDAKNGFTAQNIQADDSGDRYALELGALVAPNFLIALGYTSVAATQSLDTFNILNNGLMSATMEARAIQKDQDAITARTKYVGPIDGTNMSIGFEAGLVYGEDTLYNLKSDLYLTPKFSVGASYAEGSYKSATVPSSATGVNVNYFVTPAIGLGMSYVYANGENGANDAQLGGLSAKFRF
ncbi:carbapenem susceptibility porin CarO [Acinetobacter sp. ANC 4779]|uniref:porin Omp33-36 n=1 Tax=Acinetobacter sp. ANC 4779 TaxID=2529848 RepID=UPI00104016F6|nr:porin Omp33-36 [Acinetobacter sp. ANC 4779]TCB49336.1 carbapenem susceptibility porin CarO [Acinetobacter sp. ANC 4779]